ncbi:hypothetical protein [Leisingera sp. ANG-Vp]|uniref:hypothetical protein n=1 Tax=Leisingera sp. ANG-Vp TaxID=1577896 RepID=UPI00057D9E08|nr:hypothetical protein [Leisingera sp. ANG-Vp]KIC20928.1 hypothetical protein RA20_06620 [Leisingera sp. ANG-Vp]
MIALNSLNVASALIGQVLADANAQNAGTAQDPVLAAGQPQAQQQAKEDPFAAGDPPSLIDKQAEAAIAELRLREEKAVLRAEGRLKAEQGDHTGAIDSVIASGHAVLAAAKYSDAVDALSDEIATRNEKHGLLAAAELDNSAKENAKNMIEAGIDAEEAAADQSTRGDSMDLDDLSEKAEKAVEALDELKA